MVAREHRVYTLLFNLLLAPLGAVILVSALLLFGVRPPIVFIVGRSVRSALAACGVHTPNAVGVISTVVFYWAVIVLVGWVWERRRRV